MTSKRYIFLEDAIKDVSVLYNATTVFPTFYGHRLPGKFTLDIAYDIEEDKLVPVRWRKSPIPEVLRENNPDS